jgi:glycosyltransferase involved in cell wall biosynthesis
MTHIGINAHLLSKQAGYRSAGIHNYLHQLLTHLPSAAPYWEFTALLGGGNKASYQGMTLRPAAFETESPLKRILWEQAIQPFQLGSFDLYHAGAFVAPLLLTKPMVVTIYDLTFIRYPERLSTARRIYLQTFTKESCQRARRILAISQSTKADLVELLGIKADKIDVTPLAHDPSVYKLLPREQIETFRQAKKLPERFWFFLGTLEPRKNLVTLIEAYARLAPDSRLPLYLGGGKGWLTEPIFEAIERHKLADAITMIGFVPTDEIALWYNSAEAFLYPSVFEGFGLPVLEAMACGTPVLTSNVSSLPEVAEGAGMTLPPDDIDAWEAALKQAFEDAAWRSEASEKGLAKAKKFSWYECARLTVETYKKALGSRW